jgi:hypothetical protein
MLDWAGESQYYVEPKRLAKLGYLEAPEGAGQDARAHGLHADGQGARGATGIRRDPVTFTPLKSDPLLRLLICDLVGEDITRESIGALQEDIADIEARLDEGERSAELLPHRRKYLLMTIDSLPRYLAGGPRRAGAHSWDSRAR